MRTDAIVHVFLKIEVGDHQRGWLDFKLHYYPAYVVGQELLVASDVAGGITLLETFRIKEITHSAGPIDHRDSTCTPSVNLLVDVIDRKEVDDHYSREQTEAFMLSADEKEQLFELETFV
ncbi:MULTISPECIES: hypothetical protein [Larkinella]|jgi:hypothetical protein|uniref:Uncharacterized protein n=1 Tax=Larkinella humicola TaxID=2607654 RepID=A0A5N1JN41_9BACT|nr:MULTISPECIES: hypothetical protein [Larkinella]KAA9356857.1 hypothetical protein F0P93_03700 [Larkinella humicola]